MREKKLEQSEYAFGREVSLCVCVLVLNSVFVHVAAAAAAALLLILLKPWLHCSVERKSCHVHSDIDMHINFYIVYVCSIHVCPAYII